MNKRSWNRLLVSGMLFGAALLANCGGPEKRAPASKPGPVAPASTPTSLSVVAVVRHYADLSGQQVRLASPASRSYADSLPHEHPARNSFSIHLVPCTVEVFLNEQQCIERVSVEGQMPANQVDMSKPAVGQLVRLGELRQAFGPGKQAYRPQPLAVWGRRYPVEFSYQPRPEGRPVTVEALMPRPAYADSAMVYAISLSLVVKNTR